MANRRVGGVNFAAADEATTAKGKLKTKTESKTVVGANDTRIALYVSNPGTKDVYLALGPTAVSGEGLYLKAGTTHPPIVGYTGIVTAIASAEEPEIVFAEV